VLARRLGVDAPCRTHLLPLPGGAASPDTQALTQRFGLSPLAAARLGYRHGGRALAVLEGSAARPHGTRLVCTCEPVTEAEVRHAVRHEWATDVAGVAARTRLGLGPCGGMRCAADCARVVADELGAPPAHAPLLARAFLSAALRRRLPAVGPEQARQEALAAAHHLAELGFSPGEDEGESR
jgi:glycerol-3-phosphate dehydrogenase